MLVKLEHVTKTYGQFKLDCSLNLEEGHVTGLVGQNGAGKSTTFKAILGLIKPDSGSVQVLGKDGGQITDADKMRMGVVLSDSGFGGHLNIKAAASIMAASYSRFDRERFLRQCTEHRLPVDKKIKEFSTGMKAKLKVLCAVSHEADLLILDEPTAGLDVVAREEILDMLREYMEAEGKGILISSHISSDLEGLCDDIYMIQDGKIVLHEDTDVILSDYGLLKLEAGQYDSLDKTYILRIKEESYGYSALTDARQFYQENYPSLIVEKCGIDQVETMLIGGKRK
ncbi:ABC transporter ATP-binding protein [Anaerovorax odorimutans]|uniref:ABC transporter ATP-binding protein n=1 Tax=Anaerovorax odorimutans TaxID=109327 RepID=A0ABT1RTK0_9FIRM|nr:ABC transporter ATP-binding protein [Anaerovorax odorimutans]MCQ4638186.1 ABC transporter ATP-binding protein [Anaerovorax odorimutans]